MSQGFTKDYLVKATGETDVFVNGTKQASTSGTEIDFSIPSGVKKFVVTYVGVSAGTDNGIIQLGDASGVVATGYLGVAGRLNATPIATAHSTGMLLRGDGTTTETHGSMTFTLHDAATNTWVASGVFGDAVNTLVNATGGSIVLSSELTTVRCTNVSASTFDAGSINIQYENPELAVSGIESVAAGVTDVFVNGTLQATTSGTEYDFTVPSGITEFKLALNDVSFDASSELRVQLGDAGGIETTGYDSVASYVQGATTASSADTAGFDIANTGATLQWGGVYHFVLMDAATNLWACSAVIGTGDGTVTTAFVSGSKALSGELTTVRLTTAGGTAVGDNGSVNIQYDNQELDLGSGVISGGVVQTVHTQDGNVATSTANIPLDATIPQITEGVEILTASITPKAVGNKLRIDWIANLSLNAIQWVSAALFQDSDADAIDATAMFCDTSTIIQNLKGTYWMDAGTTDSTTFSLRGGRNVSGTMTINGSGGATLFGGVMRSSITITEYKA